MAVTWRGRIYKPFLIVMRLDALCVREQQQKKINKYITVVCSEGWLFCFVYLFCMNIDNKKKIARFK